MIIINPTSGGETALDYKESLEALKKLPWFRKAVKIAISIGQDADDDVLLEFAGNKELVLQANNATALAKMIKWASTTASMVSAPSSKPMNVSVPAAATGASDDDVRSNVIFVKSSLRLQADHRLMEKHLRKYTSQYITITLGACCCLYCLRNGTSKASGGSRMLCQDLASHLCIHRRRRCHAGTICTHYLTTEWFLLVGAFYHIYLTIQIKI